MRERLINRTGGWAALAALTVALLLAAALAPRAAAQESGGPAPPPPHWFFGVNYDDDKGASIRAIDQDGNAITSATATVDNDGSWSLIVDLDSAESVTLRLQSGSVLRETKAYTLAQGSLTEVLAADFVGAEAEAVETAAVQVRARVSPPGEPGRGRIEFGAGLVGGETVTPRSRYWPETVTHTRWLRSSPIDLGNGIVVRVIARVSDNPGREGRIEFGLYVDGVDAPIADFNEGTADPRFLPPARYFPEPRPTHDRWLVSTPVEIPGTGQ